MRHIVSSYMHSMGKFELAHWGPNIVKYYRGSCYSYSCMSCPIYFTILILAGLILVWYSVQSIGYCRDMMCVTF